VNPNRYGFQNRLFAICDQVATELNCHVVAMDNFRGETKDNHPDIWAWTSKHPYEVNDSDDGKEIHPVKADIEAVTQYINNKYGIPRSELSAIGFCWGVWPASKASNEFSFKCVVGFHPSLRFEENLGGNIVEMMNDAVNVPHLYCVAGNDPDYIKEGGDVASMIEESKHESKGESAKPRCDQFPDMMHGWVSRGDTSIKKVKDDADEALKLAVDFLKS
jgi:dienelactone hydrolase